jgi:High potential iron-sulfur protein
MLLSNLLEFILNNRRIFIAQLGLGTGALVTRHAFAQAPMVAETDPQAIALGYKANTANVDKAKYPKHAPTQACKNCQLFAGKTSDAAGPCPLFAGKQVAAAGWCSAWVAKAG